MQSLHAESIYSEERFGPESEQDEFNYDDSGDVPWREAELLELSLPNDDELVELGVDRAPAGMKVFIDTSSITVDEKDFVTRYWLVLQAGKSRNAMYEGIKCNTAEYKTYAFENKWKKDGLNRIKSPAWQKIPRTGHNQFRFEMYRYYICSDVLPRPVRDVKRLIAGYESSFSDIDPTFYD